MITSARSTLVNEGIGHCGFESRRAVIADLVGIAGRGRQRHMADTTRAHEGENRGTHSGSAPTDYHPLALDRARTVHSAFCPRPTRVGTSGNGQGHIGT